MLNFNLIAYLFCYSTKIINLIVGVDPTTKNNKGQTALVFAKDLGSKKCVKILKKCERLWRRQHKPNFVNPNPVEMVNFYDFIFERQEFLRQDLERCVSFQLFVC